MKKAIRPFDEEERLAALAELQLIGTDSFERFDRIVRITHRLFAVPMADFSLIEADQQRMVASHGYNLETIDRDIALANYSLLKTELFQVPDTEHDERFQANPLVVDQPRIRFFASFPIHTKEGARIGALSIADHEPRTLNAHDQSVFHDLAEMAENELAFLQSVQFDRVTQLQTRERFAAVTEQSLRICERQQKSAVALVFSVDELRKGRNDPLHAEHLVRVFASQLKHFFRKSDVVGRLNEHQFCVLLLDTDLNRIGPIIDKLQASIDIHNIESQGRDHLSFNHATARFKPDHPVTAEVLIDMATRDLKVAV